MFLKKIILSVWGLCTLQVEVVFLHIGTKISLNRKGLTAFAVFLLSFFVRIRRKVIFDVGCRSPPANLNFQKIQIGGTYGEIRTKKGIYQRKRKSEAKRS